MDLAMQRRSSCSGRDGRPQDIVHHLTASIRCREDVCPFAADYVVECEDALLRSIQPRRRQLGNCAFAREFLW